MACSSHYKALLLLLRQLDLERLARTHVVIMQFDILAWMVLARGTRVEQFSRARTGLSLRLPKRLRMNLTGFSVLGAYFNTIYGHFYRPACDSYAIALT